MSNIEVDTALIDRRKLSTRVLAGRAFMIKTPPCRLYLKKMTSWLTTGSQGALVYGPPRLGKTLASRWMLKMLSVVIGNVPWIEVPVRQQRIASEREFFQHVLHCARHMHYMVGTAGDKRDRLSEWLVARALRSPVNAAILFIDEAQLLTENHYKWILNIGNELDARGCRLFCLLVGQAELHDMKLKLIDAGLEQIVGRFMVREFEFPGIRSQAEVEECLAQFNNTIYPSGTGILFPANFVPRAIAHGFCLQQLSPGLWSAFQNEWLKAKFKESPIIPMHYLTASLTGILNSMVKIDSESLTVDAQVIANCVLASGYLESLSILRAIEP